MLAYRQDSRQQASPTRNNLLAHHHQKPMMMPQPIPSSSSPNLMNLSNSSPGPTIHNRPKKKLTTPRPMQPRNHRKNHQNRWFSSLNLNLSSSSPGSTFPRKDRIISSNPSQNSQHRCSSSFPASTTRCNPHHLGPAAVMIG